ncbi:RbsD/FucU family protein [Lentilitoribacter sp. EG35]|uniref:RbsD/FucU family protein n=1 Tax=Lentilitoribacter sp. EG35 TaxID=3234192 RepID=UPI0034616F89
MLIGLDPILSPELLYALRAMGHGDEIAIVDANYPASSSTEQLIRLDGVDAPTALKAVLSVTPLDIYVEDAAFSMQDAGDPDNLPAAVQTFQTIINDVCNSSHNIKQLERFAFYEHAKNAFAIVQTGETRHYGNIILKKGVLPSA